MNLNALEQEVNEDGRFCQVLNQLEHACTMYYSSRRQRSGQGLQVVRTVLSWVVYIEIFCSVMVSLLTSGVGHSKTTGGSLHLWVVWRLSLPKPCPGLVASPCSGKLGCTGQTGFAVVQCLSKPAHICPSKWVPWLHHTLSGIQVTLDLCQSFFCRCLSG